MQDNPADQPPINRIRRIVRIMDLANDAATLAAYDHAHSVGQTPPQVIAAQVKHGIVELQIFRVGPRLVMLMDVSDDFDAEGLNAEAETCAVIAGWHRRMGQLQRAPLDDGVGWPIAEPVFRQSDHISRKGQE